MTLTLKETVYYSSELQLPATMTRSEKRKRGDDCIMEMGLQDAIDTRVGGWGVKGLSGGQKKRLSICIEILTHPKLLFLDEPTSGLDSAASFYVMSRIIGNARRDHRTVISSIHQSSSQVFELFDHLCLLSTGQTIYFGPAKEANQFFATNGFPCPPLHSPSDHFLQVINYDFDSSMDLNQDVEEGHLERKLSNQQVVDNMLNAYKTSEDYQQVIQAITTIGTQKIFREHAPGRGLLTYYWLRLAIYIMMAVSLGTIFSSLGFDYNSIQAKGWLIVSVASFLTFMAIGGGRYEGVQTRKVERVLWSNNLRLGNILSSIPYLILGGGFFRLPNDLPKTFWRYPMYDISFNKHSCQGLFKDEFEGLHLRGHKNFGSEILDGRWQVEMSYSKWVNLAVLFAMAILYRVLFLAIVKVSEKLKPAIRGFGRRSTKQVKVDCS